MKTRNITLTLNKAKEFYKSGNEALKEIALQAFTEDELKPFDFRNIKTMEDVIDVLGLSQSVYEHILGHLKYSSKSTTNFYKVSLIRQALNKGLNMDFTKGDIYAPQIRCVTKGNEYYKYELLHDYLTNVGTIELACGKQIDVLGGTYYVNSTKGLGDFDSPSETYINGSESGFLGCATKEIAQHMSRYFAKVIFDAMYRDFVDYKWV